MPAVKVVAASSSPKVSLSDDGLITIADAGSACDIAPPSQDSASSATTRTAISPAGLATTASLLLAMQQNYPKSAPLALMVMLAAGSLGALAQDACQPTVEIEIHLPAGAKTSSVYGETDHYLPANSTTVRWGYYDLDAPPQVLLCSAASIWFD